MRYVRYLAYGSNLHPERLRRRIEDMRLLGPAALPGWSLEFHKRGSDGPGKCDVTERPGALAYGVVYEITEYAKATLDGIEGLGREYAERRLRLTDFGEVYFYTAMPAYIDGRLLPYDWYKAFVVDGLRYHRLAETYIRAIEPVPATSDRDPERTRANRAILASLPGRDEP